MTHLDYDRQLVGQIGDNVETQPTLTMIDG